MSTFNSKLKKKTDQLTCTENVISLSYSIVNT